MAALAMAAGVELGRWNPVSDFAPSSTAPWGVELTTTGRARCPGGTCWRVLALLDLQRAPANAVQLNGGSTAIVTLNSNNLTSRLVSLWNEAKNCQLRGGTGDTSCTAESYKLSRKSIARGACSEEHAFVATNTAGGTLREPMKFKNSLLFVGYPSNPAYAFSSTATTVTVSVALDFVDDGSTSSGTSVNACTRISNTDHTGRACLCGSAVGKYARSAWNASTYTYK